MNNIVLNVHTYINKMKPSHKKSVREQLDKTLKQFHALKSVNPPSKGWIRAIREALGINVRQFAERLNVTKSRITRIEQDELSGNITIRTMRQVADALDCVFVYGFVPRTTLDDTVKRQAAGVAKQRMAVVSHTMALENQGLSDTDTGKAVEDIIDELVRTTPKLLWETNK
jgi:predicted DNA-binding mobile mystery protein A